MYHADALGVQRAWEVRRVTAEDVVAFLIERSDSMAAAYARADVDPEGCIDYYLEMKDRGANGRDHTAPSSTQPLGGSYRGSGHDVMTSHACSSCLYVYPSLKPFLKETTSETEIAVSRCFHDVASAPKTT